jgi:hypothetical protein
MKCTAYTIDDDSGLQDFEIELPDGLTGQDLADLAEVRVCSATDTRVSLPVERDTSVEDGVTVMRWYDNDYGTTDGQACIVVCPGSDESAKHVAERNLK